MPNQKKLEDFAKTTARRAGQVLYDQFRNTEPIVRGASKDIKTIYDYLADNIIKNSIEKQFPDHSYLTEETGMTDKGSDYLWIVDPLDGTGNFVNHNPLFAVSIALWYKNKPLLGVIEAPALKERFFAFTDKGAWHHDLSANKKTRAKVSGVSNPKQAYLIYCEGGERQGERIVKIFTKFYPRFREVRKLGAASLELVWVALARAEGYITTKIHMYDIAAGLIFAREAGAKFFKFNGQEYKNHELKDPEETYDLAATNGKIKIKVA